MLVSELNFEGIISGYVNTLLDEEELESLNIDINPRVECVAEDFNKRIVHPDNINKFFSLCNWLDIKDLLKFIGSISQIGEYKLTEFDGTTEKAIQLPSFMLKIPDRDDLKAFEEALKYNNDTYIRYFLVDTNYEKIQLVAKYGLLKLLKYCIDLDESIFNIYDTIESFIKFQTIFAAAASSGSLECVELLYKHKCPWNSETCSKAAESGHLDCLKYAHGMKKFI